MHENRTDLWAPNQSRLHQGRAGSVSRCRVGSPGLSRRVKGRWKDLQEAEIRPRYQGRTLRINSIVNGRDQAALGKKGDPRCRCQWSQQSLCGQKGSDGR